jgi:hypothetical protein
MNLIPNEALELARDIDRWTEELRKAGATQQDIDAWRETARDISTHTTIAPRVALEAGRRSWLGILAATDVWVHAHAAAPANVYATEDPALLARTKAARDDAARKALDALGRYKFERFGYHAAVWVNLNRLLPARARARSPFKHVVRAAGADPAYVLEVLSERAVK